jgi:hypothetical protein
MGAPKVSKAILTMSIARTTPAQKPRGLSNNTLFWLGEVSAWFPFEMDSSSVVVTSPSIPTHQQKEHNINRIGGQLGENATQIPLRKYWLQLSQI